MLQTYGQKHTPPSSTALIMTLESVFGALISIFLGYESLKFTVGIGFVLMFSAVVISETPRKRGVSQQTEDKPRRVSRRSAK
jgi:drug/metabolite transporter (DMT)-like permease